MKLPLTVWGLTLGQALLTTGNILLVSVSALIGLQIAPSAAWTTFPVAMQFFGIDAGGFACGTFDAAVWA